MSVSAPERDPMLTVPATFRDHGLTRGSLAASRNVTAGKLRQVLLRPMDPTRRGANLPDMAERIEQTLSGFALSDV